MNHPARVQGRSETPTGSRGSLTQTIASPDPSERIQTPDPLVLRLRGAHESATTTLNSDNTEFDTGLTRGTRRQRHIQWDENVIDNEGLGRKKSKVCCIYHKPRAVGESSDESSSSSDNSDNDSDSGSDSGSGSGLGDGARPAKGFTGRGNVRRKNRNDHEHGHSHHHHENDEDGDEDEDEDEDGHDHGSDCGRNKKSSSSSSSRRKRRNGAQRKPSPNAYERMPKYDVKPLAQQPG